MAFLFFFIATEKENYSYQHLPMHFSNRLLLAISMGYSFSGK